MTTGVTLSCFILSYLIALALELSRLYLKMPWRMGLIFITAGLALLTHGLYIGDRFVLGRAATGHWQIPSSLFDWGLVAAWLVAALYFFLLVRRPTNAIGPFLLPLVLAMIVAAVAVRSGEPFDRTAGIGVWSIVHSTSLSLGMATVTFGFATALMNLYQEYRLKRKRGLSSGMRLPSLEYLHTVGRSCLVVTTIAFSGGLISGIALNFQKHGVVKWLEGGIVFSFGLLIWLFIASLLEWQAARRTASWAAYLNIASFSIVVIALLLVFAKPHGRKKNDARTLQPSGGIAIADGERITFPSPTLRTGEQYEDKVVIWKFRR
jgi:ABC-type uncharacterized transport system permease subunit